MDKILKKYDSRRNRRLVLLFASTTLFIWVLRKYFAGGVCNIRRNLKGKVYIVTGANTGIGRETALKLAEFGGRVVLACRDINRTQSLLDELHRNYGKDSAQFIQLELSSYKSVVAFAEEFKRNYSRLDALINNAGVMAVQQRTLTEDGNEI
jgi:retinol dehydrogenase-13